MTQTVRGGNPRESLVYEDESKFFFFKEKLKMSYIKEDKDLLIQIYFILFFERNIVVAFFFFLRESGSFINAAFNVV